MSLLKDFTSAFLGMSLATRSPDSGMRWEQEGPVSRYIGEGAESYWYSISLLSPCVSQAEVRHLVHRESEKARLVQRHHEWKVYDFPEAPSLRGCLEENGYQVDRTCRLLF